MMRLPVATLLAFALAYCATVASDDRVWLVGTWCPDGRTTYAGVEVGLWPTRFDADGTYATFEDEGRWRLQGGALLLEREIGMRVRRTERVEQLGADVMAWTIAHGEREIWRRCPAES